MSASTILTSKRTISAIVCSLSLAAMAATPVAVWDGDFTTLTKGTFTLSENGNTKTDSYLQISGDNGITVTSTDALNVFTVIMRCSGLNLAAENAQVLFTSYVSDSQANLTGYYLLSGNSNTKGIWDGADWSSESGATKNSVPTNYTTLIYNHQQTNGTYGYALGPTSGEDETVVRTTLYSVVGLRSSGTTYHGFNIGGLRGTTSATLLPATDLKITSLAVFEGTLTEAEMKDFMFVSEMPTIEISGSKNWSELNVPSGAADVALKVTGDSTVTINENVSLSSLHIVSTDAAFTLNIGSGVTADIAVYDCSDAKGQVTLNISQGESYVVAGLDTALKGLGTGAISIGFGKKLTISESGIQKAQLTNNGTLNIVGGTSEAPIEIYDNGGANTGMGVITLAANAYVRSNATGGNKLYTITGASDGSSTIILSSGQNWGMTNGTAIRQCKVLVRAKDFWWERAAAFDKTVDLDYGTITLHLGNPDSTFEIGSVTGSGSINRGNANDTLTIYANRIDGELSGVPNYQFPITVKGTHVQAITSATGAITVDGGVVRLGSQAIPSLQNGGTVKYGYSAIPTVQLYSGSGNFEVDMAGTGLVPGTQYKVVGIAGVTADKVSVTGVDGGSGFQLYTVADGVVLSDVAPSTAIWTGNSGTWTDSTFDGKAIATDGEVVAFADAASGAESVTVTLSGAKTVAAANFTANTTAYELAGDVLTGPVNLSGSALVTLKTAPVIGDGELTGLGPIVLDFGDSSIFTMPANNTNYIGEATIASGTVKMGNARSFGNFGRAASIRVKSGATLDANGASNGGSTGTNNRLILEEGAVFTNSVSLSDIKFFAFYDLTVEGDATIVAADANNGLTRHFNTETYVHLGTNTLTKTGSNTFYMSAPTIDGSGTIVVAEGTLNVARAYYTSTQPSFSNGTFIVRSDASLVLQDYNGGANLTVKNIVLEGTGTIGGRGSVTATEGVEVRTQAGVISAYSTYLTAATSVSATGNGILAFGTTRPSGTIALGEDVGISVRMQNSGDSVIELSFSRSPASVTVYDENGDLYEDASYSYDAESETLTIFSACTLEAGTGTTDFDDSTNWNGSVKPINGAKAVVKVTGDVTLAINGEYSLAALTFSGEGNVEIVGDGSISADTLAVVDGATFSPNGKVSAAGITLALNSVLCLRDTTVTAPISGAGAVETYGTVVLAHANTMTGGITVKPGSLLSASEAGAYGEYSTGWAYTAQRRVIVEDGGTVDINNIANDDSAVALTIAGKGVLVDGVYAGAVKYSGPNAITSGSRQISSIVLMDDALVDLGAGWGLVHSGWGDARLGLNGHTLTVRGTGIFPVVNVNNVNGAATTGTLVLDGARLELSNRASNLAGIDIIAKGCASNHIATAPSAIGSFTLKPSATGTIAGVWNFPSGFVPSLDTSNVDPTGLSGGQVLTLFTAPSALSSSTISVNAGGRFTTAIVGNTVTATVKAGIPANYIHYDFNNGTDKNTARAADSFATIDIGGEAGGGGSNGRSAIVYNNGATRYTPYWNSYSVVDSSVASKSPMHACEMTVTTVARLKQTDMIIWGLGSAQTGVAVIGLVALSPTSAAVVTKSESNVVDTVVTISNTPDLTKGYHFFAVVANASGTTLYVDNACASSEKTLPQGIGQYGQLGSFHYGAQNVDAPGANLVGAAGFLLDDWRIYDAALSHAEIRAVKREICPDPLFIRLR